MKGWFRYYRESMHDISLLALSDADFRMWMNFNCMADDKTGALPPVQGMALALRCDPDALLTVVERLASGGHIDRASGGPNGWHYAMHGWAQRQYKSDSSTERSQRCRTAARNAAVAPSEAEAETESEGKTSLSSVPSEREVRVSSLRSETCSAAGDSALFVSDETGETPRPVRKYGLWPTRAAAMEAFEKFWALYFKKSGRTEAFEKFVIYVDPAEMDDLIQATITHATFRAQDIKPQDPDGRKFTQGAKTWLLNRRWRDWLKHEEVAAQVAAVVPVLTPAQKSAADARRKRDLLLAEMERRQAEKATQGSLLP